MFGQDTYKLEGGGNDDEIRSSIMQIDGSKAIGIDGADPKVLQKLLQEITRDPQNVDSKIIEGYLKAEQITLF